MENFDQWGDKESELVERLPLITRRHSIRMYNIAKVLEQTLNLDEGVLSTAALFHDVGKYYLSESILNKPGRLTNLERKIVNYHAYFSFELLNETSISEEVRYIILYHHTENPETLMPVEFKKTEKILEYAKILHTIDVYEALTSSRPYRDALTREEAFDLMSKTENANYHEKTIEFLKNSYV